VNKWLITALIIVVVLVLVGVAYDQGLFDNINGSTLGMILAGVAAPYMAIKNWLFGDKLTKEFKEKYLKIQEDEIGHRAELDSSIKAKEQRVAQLDKEIQLLDAKMEVLELKKKKVEQTVNSMTLDETKREAQNLFGD
jgi:TPP-dependent 2-oxoacid decarboxylase